MPPQAEVRGPSLYEYSRSAPLEDLYLNLNFSYLEKDRLSQRSSKYGRTDFQFNEAQIPEWGLFPSEGEKVMELMDICRGKGYQEQVLPVLHLALFAHQTQFRESGDPYTMHPLEMAIEAARDYDADWQTVALCLIHDIKEDAKRKVPPYMVEYVYNNLRRKNEHLNITANDVKFLLRGMDVLSKASMPKEEGRVRGNIEKGVNLITRRQKEKRPTLETVKKIYAAFLGGKKIREEDIRVVLVKLLDRRYNMSTIGFLPKEKQRKKARETLEIYVPMAEAFHLIGLRDELTKFALDVLDGPESKYMESIYEGNLKVKNIYDIPSVTSAFSDSLEDKNVDLVSFSVPGYHEIYELLSGDKDFNPTFDLNIIMKDMPGEDTKKWRLRAADVYATVVKIFGVEISSDGIGLVSLDDIEKKELETKFIFRLEDGKRVEVRINIYGKNQYIASRASFVDLYPDRRVPHIGTPDQWRYSARQNIEDVHRRFKRAKTPEDFALFLKTAVTGEKEAINKGEYYYVQREGTLFDVLYSIYRNDVFRASRVHIRKPGSSKVEIVSSNEFGMDIPRGVIIEGLDVFDFEPLNKMDVTPPDVRKSRDQGVKADIIEMLEEKAAKDELFRRDVTEAGLYFLEEDYKKAWSESQYGEPGEDEMNCFLPLKLDKMKNVFADYYTTFDDLGYAIGAGTIPRSVNRRLIRELVSYRDNFVCLDCPLENEAEKVQIQLILKQFGIETYKEAKLPTGDIGGGKSHFRVWFHESELGDEDQRLDRCNELLRKLINEGIVKTERRGNREELLFGIDWNKLPIEKSPLPPVEVMSSFERRLD